MCDDRERLIGYVYDECDRDERRAIEGHLSECAECRAEIGGLRQARQDLLAWDVPDHEPVWRPMAPPRVEGWWRQVPAWAMAAAATLVFVAGAAGGMATRLLWPAEVAGSAMRTAAAPAAVAASATVTAADLVGVETRILDRVRAEMTQRLETVAAHDAARPAQAVRVANRVDGANPSVEALARRIADIEQWRQKQVNYNVENENRMRSLRIAAISSQQFETTRLGAVQPVNFNGR
jgi:hypothetical protein